MVMEIQLRCRRSAARNLFFILLAVELVLVGVYVALWVLPEGVPDGAFASLMNLDGEWNLPTWFSSVQLFVIGALFAAAAQSARRPESVPSLFPYTVGSAFVFLSMDEGAAFHERISEVARENDVAWILIEGHGAWITVYAVVGVVFLLSTLPYFLAYWHHARREAIIITVGAAVFVLGAVGFEIASYLFLRDGNVDDLYRVEVAIEEFFEMSGGSIMLVGALLLASRRPVTSSDHRASSDATGDGPGAERSEERRESRTVL